MPTVTALCLTLLAVVAAGTVAAVLLRAPAAEPFWAAVRAAAAVVAMSAVLGAAAALTWWQGAGTAAMGLAVAVGGAVLLAASPVELPRRWLGTDEMRTVAGLGCVAGLVASGADGHRLWLALLAVGWRRRVAEPAYRSWTAYGPGLVLALGPSLLRAVTDSGNLRPLLLGLAALLVLASGVARRLQAPLVIGSAVLVADAVVQLAPYLAAFYDVVPRWVTIGAVGLVLLAAGATYEQRVRDLRRVGRRVAGLS